jgi:hypothetical protein
MAATGHMALTASHFLPAVNPQVIGADPPPNAAVTGFINLCTINEVAALANNGTVTKIGMYADNAATLTVKIVLRNSSTSVDVAVSQSFSHPGGGWADLTLTTSFIVPPSGSYYVGAFFGNDPSVKVNSAARAIASSNITGASQAIVESSGNVQSFRVTYG